MRLHSLPIAVPVRVKADLSLLLVAVLWGSAFAALRVAAQVGTVYLFNAARFFVAALLLLPFGHWSDLKRGQWAWMWLAGLVLFVASALQQSGLVSTSASNAGFLTGLYVVLVPLVVFLGWRETPHALQVMAVALAAAGAFLLSTGGRFDFKSGDALEIAGAAFWAFHVVIVARFASRFDVVSFSAGQLLAAAAFNGVAGAIHESLPWPIQPALAASILYTAVVSIALGHTVQIWGQKRTPPIEAAIILSLEAVFAALAGRIVLGERLMPTQIGGCALILFAAVLAQVRGWGRIRPAIGLPARYNPTGISKECR
jgi:drug/metabolite transporter (DMT)-like permease